MAVNKNKDSKNNNKNNINKNNNNSNNRNNENNSNKKNVSSKIENKVKEISQISKSVKEEVVDNSNNSTNGKLVNKTNKIEKEKKINQGNNLANKKSTNQQSNSVKAKSVNKQNNSGRNKNTSKKSKVTEVKLKKDDIFEDRESNKKIEIVSLEDEEQLEKIENVGLENNKLNKDIDVINLNKLINDTDISNLEDEVEDKQTELDDFEKDEDIQKSEIGLPDNYEKSDTLNKALDISSEKINVLEGIKNIQNEEIDILNKTSDISSENNDILNKNSDISDEETDKPDETGCTSNEETIGLDEEVDTLDKSLNILNKEINELDKEINLSDETKNKATNDDKLKKTDSFKKSIRLIVLVIVVLGLGIYFISPKIRLVGKKEVTLGYQDEFVEPGYYAKKMGKDITNMVKVFSNVDNHKVGKYEITYQVKYGFLKIKKTRVVNIVDKDKPVISVEKDIKICPNEKIKNIKFKASDEYDGDLTDRVLLEKQGNRLKLKVVDSSNNEEVVLVNLTREDKEAPKITLTGGEGVYSNYGTEYQELGYKASDNCDGDLTDKVVVDGEVKKEVGTYYLTYTVKDSSMNETVVKRTIIVRRNNPVNNGSIANGTIYLTFDDGPNEGTTNIILDILKEENIKATFFVTCSGPDYLIKRIYDEGHTIALHTATHDYGYVYSSAYNYFNDLGRVSDRVKNITGVESKIIRFPGGSSNTVSRQYKLGIMSELTNLVVERGYRYYDWNVDADDAGSAYTSDQVYNNVISGLSPYRANMVLMHDIKYQTRDALREIIRYGKNNGYSFKKIEMDTYMIRHGVNN